MSKRQTEFFIVDIFIAIDVLQRLSKKIHTVDDFVFDEILCAATSKQLEIIGEAMKHVLNDETLKDLTMPKWRKIADLRNVVIHDYFNISYGLLFDILKREISILETELFDFVKRLSDKTVFMQAILSAKEELAQLKRTASINYLSKLETL